jgi:hypothetical protein
LQYSLEEIEASGSARKIGGNQGQQHAVDPGRHAVERLQ